MSLILAIECSTKSLSVALFQEGRLLQEIASDPDDRTHSEKLLPLVQELLSGQKKTIQEVTEVAIAAGPGAFTSLRVGMATVLGLIASRSVPILPVSSLKALAWPLLAQGDSVAAVMRAGRGRLYGAVYQQTGGKTVVLVPEKVFEPQELVTLLKDFPSHPVVVGPGSEDLNGIEASYILPGIVLRASSVGWVALKEPESPMSPEQVDIRYLQAPDLGGS